MAGGPSQLDLFDYKPRLAKDHGKPTAVRPSDKLVTVGLEKSLVLGPMIADARIVFARIHDTSGTIGAMLHEGPSGKISTLRTRFVQLREQTFGGEVDLSGRANLATRMRSALARVDSVRALLASPRSSFGRFRRDSTLGSTVAALRDELTVLQITVDSADGNVKRFKSDSALTRSVEDSRRAMSQLFDDIRRRPFHYVHF